VERVLPLEIITRDFLCVWGYWREPWLMLGVDCLMLTEAQRVRVQACRSVSAGVALGGLGFVMGSHGEVEGYWCAVGD
jgi:hypothetical protein